MLYQNPKVRTNEPLNKPATPAPRNQKHTQTLPRSHVSHFLSHTHTTHTHTLTLPKTKKKQSQRQPAHLFKYSISLFILSTRSFSASSSRTFSTLFSSVSRATSLRRCSTSASFFWRSRRHASRLRMLFSEMGAPFAAVVVEEVLVEEAEAGRLAPAATGVAEAAPPPAVEELFVERGEDWESSSVEALRLRERVGEAVVGVVAAVAVGTASDNDDAAAAAAEDADEVALCYVVLHCKAEGFLEVRF
ncbi:hypothetical protein DFJ73DRAFT_179643 [Zopfochytrium polystomum]|nr:hypothetical protein DFJ73DRAFT_179643 [Zopfochytrium polystomum]